MHAAEGLASRGRGESGRNDHVAGKVADVSEVVLPRSGPEPAIGELTRRANCGLVHRSKPRLYSINSSARASSVGGIVMPSALAVLRLTISSSLVGSSTGRSPGLAPFRILST
jgi:hypothetical protein